MTEKELRDKVNELLDSLDFRKEINGKVDYLIKSGRLGCENYPSNYYYPKMLLSVIFERLSKYYYPPYPITKDRKEINNLKKNRLTFIYLF